MKAIYIACCVSILTCTTLANAGPSAHRTQEGSGLLNQLLGTHNADQKQTAPTSRQAPAIKTAGAASGQAESGLFDGVWKGSDGQTLLIKRIHRSLYASGSDRHSAWQAQCIIISRQAKCLGNGISDRAGKFNYESSLNPDGPALQSDWTRHYNHGQPRSGRTGFNKQQAQVSPEH